VRSPARNYSKRSAISESQISSLRCQARNLAVPEVDKTRHLGVSREKEIASNLSFLLATSDESLKVIAVCVEEHYNGEGITIRIASSEI
jgi:hypothetical protein